MTNVSHEFNSSSRRINTLIRKLGLKSYLEIGVRSGDTLFSIEAPLRTGVDPYFNFNPEDHISDAGLALHQVTSDVFFHSLDRSVKFDIVLIDGLHTFEQTYRDFQHVLLHSHPKTIILIDDTVPCDVFSTLRDSSRCTRLRSKYGNPADGRWHGDTYKVIPMIVLFHPLYKIATMVDRGNPQTLVWMSNKSGSYATHDNRKRAFEAVSSLSEFDYIAFLDSQDIYNTSNEEDAMQQVFMEFCNVTT